MTAIVKISSDGETTIPQEIRVALDVESGGLLEWELTPEGRVEVRRAPLDTVYLGAVSSTLTEWDSPEDREAYRGL